jgi:hypothetical protein
MVWSKSRSAATANTLYDTVRGATFELQSNAIGGQTTESSGLNQFNSNGYRIGSANVINNTGATFVSWTFREQAKFFDVVTWSGNSVAGRTISHNLGSVPGCIIVKRTDSYGYGWPVYHRSIGATQALELQDTFAAFSSSSYWNNTAPTSSVFSLGTDVYVNETGGNYVAYLFAHDAGGFGLLGNENAITCGSFTTDGSGNATVSLGYEPQWLMVKASSAAQSWYIEDNMRAFNLTSRAILFPNLSNAEATGATAYLAPNSTGFAAVNGQLNASTTYIYIAIRRGPMKVPTTGTSVFVPTNVSSSGTFTSTANFPIDLIFYGAKAGTDKWYWFDRLRGTGALASNNTSAEAVGYPTNFASNVNFQQTGITGDFSDYISYDLRRAPSFFDEVCYTGTGSARTVSHNLQAVPELMIVKKRSATGAGSVYSAAIGNTQQLELFSSSGNSAAFVDTTQWNSTTPTSTVFTVGTNGAVNGSGATYVAYLFATCAGVSKVGSYTGTGTTKQIDCGFTGGARFVLIKRTDSTGDWYVWDSARGIVAGNDPYLFLNSTAVEVTGTDYVDTYAAGFEISSTAPAAINANGGTFIFLAIA